MPYIIDRGKVILVNVNNKYDSKPLYYKMSDIHSVFTHWDPTKRRNIETPNELPGVYENK